MNKSISINKVILILIGFVVVIIVGIMLTPDSTETTETFPSDSKAFIIATNFITPYLLSPSTADYPLLDFNVVRTINRYKVESYVDSQNAFGAVIRNDWIVILEYNGTGEPLLKENWSLDKLIIGGQAISL